MAKLLDDNSKLVAVVERNKTRIKVGIEESGWLICSDTDAYAERWLGMDELTWLIDELVRARRGMREYKRVREVEEANALKAVRSRMWTARKVGKVLEEQGLIPPKRLTRKYKS